MACKYSGMEFVSQVALDYVANKGNAVPTGVWPPGGVGTLPEAKPVEKPKEQSNFTYPLDEGRYGK